MNFKNVHPPLQGRCTGVAGTLQMLHPSFFRSVSRENHTLFSHVILTPHHPRSFCYGVNITTVKVYDSIINLINYLIIIYFIYVLGRGVKGREGVASAVMWWPLVSGFQLKREWFFLSEFLGSLGSQFYTYFSSIGFPTGIKPVPLSINFRASLLRLLLPNTSNRFPFSQISGSLESAFCKHFEVGGSTAQINLVPVLVITRSSKHSFENQRGSISIPNPLTKGGACGRY
jgi:hypothetical protein